MNELFRVIGGWIVPSIKEGHTEKHTQELNVPQSNMFVTMKYYSEFISVLFFQLTPPLKSKSSVPNTELSCTPVSHTVTRNCALIGFTSMKMTSC